MRRKDELNHKAPAEYLAPELWPKGATWATAFFAECEAWRASTGESPSAFSKRLGITPAPYLVWVNRRGAIPQLIDAAALWRVIEGLIELRKAHVRKLLGGPGVTVESIGGARRELFRCPVCNQDGVLEADYARRTWNHHPRGLCPLREHGIVTWSPQGGYTTNHDLMRLGEFLPEQEPESAKGGRER